MFGERCIDEIQQQVGNLLETYKGKIDEVYTKTPEELSITFTAKIAPGKHPLELVIETSMAFVAERVKDKTKGIVDERQMRLADA